MTTMPPIKSQPPGCCFIEIEAPKPKEDILPERIECYVLENISPKSCGPLTRDLNFVLPLRRPTSTSSSSSEPKNGVPPASPFVEDGCSDADASFPKVDHLKRIRRRPATAEEISFREQTKPVVQAEAEEQQPSNPKRSDDTNVVAVQDGNVTSSSTKHSNGGDEHHPQKRPKPNNNVEGNKSINNIPAAPKQSKKMKKRKQKNKQQNSTPWSLDILVGSVEEVNHSINNSKQQQPQESLLSILHKHNISPQSPNFIRRSLPGRPAHTKTELDEWNKTLWPTLFFEEKTDKFKEEKLALTSEEVATMIQGMKEAVKDAHVGQQQWMQWKKSKNASNDDKEMPQLFGVVVMNPDTGSIVSRSFEERQQQGIPESSTGTPSVDEQNASGERVNAQTPWSSFPDETNLLCTPVLLAIQGVSRKERLIAMGAGMGSDEFQSGQVNSC